MLIILILSEIHNDIIIQDGGILHQNSIIIRLLNPKFVEEGQGEWLNSSYVGIEKIKFEFEFDG